MPGLARAGRWPGLAGAVRVATVATVVFAAFAVAAAALLDAVVARRVLWEVDQGLLARLQAFAPAPPTEPMQAPVVGTDGVPIYLWQVAPSGVVARLTAHEPRLAAAARSGTGLPLSIQVGGRTLRFESVPDRAGSLVAAQDLGAPSHIDRVLLIAELVMGPMLLVAVFAGVLVIGVRSAAPVEAARRRLLELTADASHELRTPLTVIEAEIELARASGPDPVADREALEHIARESRRLKSIVEDLLWLARFDAPDTRPLEEAAPVDLGSVVEACAARFVAVAASRRLDFSCDTVPVNVEAVPAWLDRLAGTLIDNACRYAPEGGTVRIGVRESAGRAVLSVEDNGPGIPEGSALFDRFRRGTDKPGGAGLGLAIADSVVRLTSGRWRVGRSALGGAGMEVSWRVVASPAAVPGPSRPAEVMP